MEMIATRNRLEQASILPGRCYHTCSSRPTIAVAIAARNASHFLADTLESLAAQTQLPDQIVFYDDRSQDDTLAVANRYASALPMMTIHWGISPVGISAARNRANAQATADYIAVLDADDGFEPDAIQAYCDSLLQHPDTDLLYADTRVANASLERSKHRRYPRFSSPREGIRGILGSPLVPFKHSSMVYRRSVFNELGGYDESLPIKVDVELFLRFLAGGRVVTKLDQVTSIHRKHRKQISARRLQGLKAYAMLIQRYESAPLMRAVLHSTRIPSELLKMLLRG